MHANITLKPRDLAKVVLAAASGGFVGTLLRDLLTRLEHISSPTLGYVDWTHEIPWALLIINFLGVYLATRLLRGPLRHHDPNDLTRVLVITGFFGGLTSYSGLFVALGALWHVCVGGSLMVAFGAVISGVIAGWLGLMRRTR
jgi:fluoride ion exporter CrcB/FEX